MERGTPIAVGLPVYGADGQAVGAVEAADDAGITVAGRRIPSGAVARVTARAVYLHEPAAARRPAGGALPSTPTAEAPGPAQRFPAPIGEGVPPGAPEPATPGGIPGQPGAARGAPTLYAFTWPVLPEQAEALRDLAAALQGPRREEFAALRRRMGVTREAWWYRPAQGELIVAFAVADPAAAFAAFTNADDAFARWLKRQLREITGRDPLEEPSRGPAQEPLLAWAAP
ncbi:MAG TPA: hypothetical protein VFL91_32445 [Thermomicrobiales bacterium]|nr:hypothetical protein [Thermomicrobiales bacterium]